MKDLGSLLEKLFQEKEEQKRQIIKEAEEKKGRVLEEIEAQAEEEFKTWLEKKKEACLRAKEEEIFGAKLLAVKEILEEKRRILEKAVREIEKVLEKAPQMLPTKEVVTKEGREFIPLSIPEFISFLKETYAQDIDKLFPL